MYAGNDSRRLWGKSRACFQGFGCQRNMSLNRNRYALLSIEEKKAYHREFSRQRHARKKEANLEIKDKKTEYDAQYYIAHKDRKKDYDRRKYSIKKGNGMTCDLNSDSVLLVTANEDSSTEIFPDANVSALLVSNFQSEGKSEYLKRYRRTNLYSIRSEENEFRQRLFRRENRDRVAEYSRQQWVARTVDEKQRVYRRQLEARTKDRRKENRRLRAASRRVTRSWRTPRLVRDYFDSVASRLHVRNFGDWYRVSSRQIEALHGSTIFNKFGTLGAALQFAYPDLSWELARFSLRGKKSCQRWLKVLLKKLLPGVEVIEDFQHSGLRKCGEENFDRTVEFDLWLPSHRIGLEYQGEHHYFNVDSAFGPFGNSIYVERDRVKVDLCQLREITLLCIPFWWDGELESLAATLFQARPDVFPLSTSSPIPSQFPFPIEPRRREDAE